MLAGWTPLYVRSHRSPTPSPSNEAVAVARVRSRSSPSSLPRVPLPEPQPSKSVLNPNPASLTHHLAHGGTQSYAALFRLYCVVVYVDTFHNHTHSFYYDTTRNTLQYDNM